jgi:hypothetical protein
MLACARQAMTWSQEQFGPGIQFHLRGHSEGTLIALFLYEKLLSEEPALAAKVSSLVLSGLGLESSRRGTTSSATSISRFGTSKRVMSADRRRSSASCRTCS